MTDYKFHGILYRNVHRFLEAVAETWISESDAATAFAGATDEELAAEANNCWRLSENNEFYMAHLVAAFGDLRHEYMFDKPNDDVTSVMIDGEAEEFFDLRAELAVKAIEEDVKTVTISQEYFASLAEGARKSLENQHDEDVYNGPLSAINDAVNYFAECTRFMRPNCEDMHAVGISRIAAVIGAGPWEYYVREATAELFNAHATGSRCDIVVAQVALHRALTNVYIARGAARVARVVYPRWTPQTPADDLTAIDGVSRALAIKLNMHGLTTIAQIAALTGREVAALDRALNMHGAMLRVRNAAVELVVSI
jgi:predicted flap endonuclease-1-like 5' DNA nuclease